MEANIRKFEEILKDVPLSFPIETFRQIYPSTNACLDLPPDGKLMIDHFIYQLLCFFQGSIRQLNVTIKGQAVTIEEEKQRVIEEKQRVTEEKQRVIEEKQRATEERERLTATIEDKERIIEVEKQRVTEERQRLTGTIKDKEQIINDKEQIINVLNESTDVAQALRSFVSKPVQKWGTVTRSQAWDMLSNDECVQSQDELKNQFHDKRDDLLKSMEAINPHLWPEETAMYPDIIKAIREGLYKGDKSTFVVDTHSKGTIRVNICVANSDNNSCLPYCIGYFLELKFPKGKLDTAENCGQVLDYFNAFHEYQPHRVEFVGILSNFKESLVLTANYASDKVTITQQWAETLADAIIFADKTSKSQYQVKIPELHNQLGSQYNIIQCSHLHFLLSVPKPPAKSKENTPLTHTYGIRSKVNASSPGNDFWTDPSRHTRGKEFVLKTAYGGDKTVANEIAVLKRLRTIQCQHLPELVWSPSGDQEFGISPVGSPIDFKERQGVSRIIVCQLLDGLEFLHREGIVHRDIRPSNLIVEYMPGKVNVVIIDFENALFLGDDPEEVEYFGGFISWPRRLLHSPTKWYIPRVEDDLFASILLVLHMLFPVQFNTFRASKIEPHLGALSHETVRLIQLWEGIEKSPIWEPFVKAAEEKNYEKLKGMAEFFLFI